MFRRHKCVIISTLIVAGVILTVYKNNKFKVHTVYKYNSSNKSYSKPHPKLSYRFPRIMIIGFGKSGTRALYEALKLHPLIRGPPSEKRFFSRHYSTGLESYLNSLPLPPLRGYTVEKSPDYIINRRAPSRILSATSFLEINPATLKFIVVLRNPIDRAVSEYLQWNIERKSSHSPSLPPFPEMILNSQGEIDNTVPFINASCYAYHIKNWLRYFDEKQLCYVDGDRFVSNPYEEVDRLEQCLGLDHYFTEKNFVYNKTKGFYCFTDPRLKFAKPLCMGISKGRKHPRLPQSTVMKLESFYKPLNNQLPDISHRVFELN